MQEHSMLSTRTTKIGNQKHLSTNLPIPFLHQTIHDVGHDLRSPLFVIRGYSQLLQKTQEKERLERGFQLMEEASVKMEKIINGFVQLMDIYTVPSAKMELISLNTILKKVESALMGEKNETQVTINKNFPSNSQVYYNQQYLYTILYSLLDNSVRHNQNQEDLEITIDLTNEKNDIFLNITDNGKGIDLTTDKEKIKQPFYKQEESTDSVGIGLAKVQAIAQVSQSTFHIESKKEKGTKCIFVFKDQYEDLNRL